MAQLTSKLKYFKKMKTYSPTHPFLFWFAFFPYFTILYQFGNLASLLTDFFNVLLKEIVIFLFLKIFD